jgi:hypothetical protein
MNAWDLDETEPERMIDSLLDLRLDECRLGLSYHGGRMLLPANARHVVYEHHPGAIYFHATPDVYGRLRPCESPLASTVAKFLAASEKRKFPVQAWTVLCHNDALGQQHPECCIENAFGERYPYALCPSNPETQEYIVALCREIAALPGVRTLDLEALSYMGYDHHSLHEKCGIALPPETRWLLSVCFCQYCRPSLPDADEVRRHIRLSFDSGQAEPIDPNLKKAVLQVRRQTILVLLSQLRGLPVNLRFTPLTDFTGGKTALSWCDVSGAVPSVTLTFFGSTIDAMRSTLGEMPDNRKLRVEGGFIFHGPDCAAREDVAARIRVLRDANIDGIGFYSYSMAARYQLDWLRRAIQELLI